jgi:phosphohistidine phosphatase SixA
MKPMQGPAKLCRPVALRGLRLFLALPLLALLLLPLPAAAAAPRGAVLLVRHAERASTAADSLLSPAGLRRAECLADSLRDAGIGTIFATEVERTQQTAQPLARRLHLSLRIVPKAAAADLVRAAESAAAAGRAVLVVGHADTLPAIVHGLGAAPIPPYGDAEYDRLVVVPMGPAGAGPPLILRYCDTPAAP